MNALEKAFQQLMELSLEGGVVAVAMPTSLYKSLKPQTPASRIQVQAGQPKRPKNELWQGLRVSHNPLLVHGLVLWLDKDGRVLAVSNEDETIASDPDYLKP